MEKLSARSLAYIFLGTILPSLLAPVPAIAQFRFETTGSYTNLDTTFTEDDQYSGSISWFIFPVDETKGPLAEAAFLSRSSSLRYSYTRTENRAQFPNPAFLMPLPGPSDPMEFVFQVIVDREEIINTHMIDTRYVVADTPWIVGSSFSITDGDVSTNGAPSDLDNWSSALVLGRYVLTNTTVSFRAEYGDREMTTNSTLELSSLLPNIEQIGEFASEVEIETCLLYTSPSPRD